MLRAFVNLETEGVFRLTAFVEERGICAGHDKDRSAVDEVRAVDKSGRSCRCVMCEEVNQVFMLNTAPTYRRHLNMKLFYFQIMKQMEQGQIQTIRSRSRQQR